MASASSTSARNLFQDSKTRLSERVQVCNFNVSAFTCPLQANINSIGSLARQIQRGSKSQEILGQTVKNFAAVESTVISTENNIAKLQVLSCFLLFFHQNIVEQVLTAQLEQQEQQVAASCEKLGQVRCCGIASWRKVLVSVSTNQTGAAQ